MGVVYLGVSPAGRAVAVKVIRPRYAADDSYRARFRREAAAARTVTGAFTAAVLDADPDAAEPYLVTAYLIGVSLREAVALGALPPASVRTLAAGLLEALADIHRAGIAHRDVKPGNIMLTQTGPRVIDFGFARPDDATSITRVGTVLGTPGFLAPEQVHGEVAGPAADVFALGAVLVFAATGRAPFGAGDTESKLRRVAAADADLAGIDDRVLLDLIAACLTVDPTARPSAAALLDRLDHAEETAGWLPVPVAEVIDRRAAAARLLVGPGHQRLSPPAAPAAIPNETTIDPSFSLPAGKPGGVSRRAVLLGGGATLVVAAGVVAGAAALADDRVPGVARAASNRPSTSTEPVREWRVLASNSVLEMFAAGGTVIASSFNSGGIRALDPETGDLVWQRDTDVVTDIHTDTDTAILVNPKGWRVTAVDAATGAEKWAYDVPPGEVSRSAVVAGDVVCFGTGMVRGVGVADGQPRWTADVLTERGFVAAGDVLVSATLEKVTGVDANTGAVRWAFDVPQQPADPRAANGMAYVCDADGTIRAVRAADGVIVWQQPGLGSSAPPYLTADADTMYYSADGAIRAFAADTGAPLWTRPIGRRTGAPDVYANWDKSTVVLVGDALYVVSNDENLYEFDVGDGRVRWRYPGVSGWDVVESAGLLFVGTRDGYVEAIRPPGGG